MASLQEVVIERVFDAPREKVFEAWTNCQHLMHWWGPGGFTAPACEIDLRVGGRFLNCMRSADGEEFWSTGVYKEIVPPERIVCTDSFADEDGNVVPASYYGMPDEIPLEMMLRVTFEEHHGGTTVTIRHEGLPAGEQTDGAREGWNQSLDKLEDYLAEEE